MPKKAGVLIRDIKPQLFKIENTQAAANTFQETEHALPVLLDAGYVFELYKIYWELDASVEQADGDQIYVHFTTESKAAIADTGESGVFAKIAQQITGAAGNVELTGVIDFSDGAGNGLLIGRKSIYVGILGSGQTNAVKIGANFLYKLTKVSTEELVGLMTL